jgi:hypothetical protein
LFEAGYEALKKATGGFSVLTGAEVLGAVLETPIAFDCPPFDTWVHFLPNGLTLLRSGPCRDLSQGFVRTLDRKISHEPASTT